MDWALDEHKEQDLYVPSVQPCSGRAWGWSGSRPGKPNALPCNMESVWTGRLSSPLGYILRWWWPVLASEEMLVSSSGGISAL